MKILATKTGGIRKAEYPSTGEENGKICENCSKLVPYKGTKMYKISARVHTHLTVTCYFCQDCTDCGKTDDELVLTAVDKREKKMANLMSNAKTLTKI